MNKIDILFKQMNLTKEEQEKYKDLSLIEVTVDSDNERWTFVIESPFTLSLEDYKYFLNTLIKCFDKIKNIDLELRVRNQNYELLNDYYKYILSLLKDKFTLANIFSDCLKIEENNIYIDVSNKIEEKQINGIIDDINIFLKKTGYNSAKVRINEDIRNKVLNEIKDSIKKVNIIPEKEGTKEKEEKQETKKTFNSYRKSNNKPEEGCILGRTINDKPLLIKSLIGEDNNVTIEGYIFGVDAFESSKSAFKILTLKVTDYSDSIYVKVFSREEEDFNRLKKNLKEGKWVKIRGYSKVDTYSNNELVLNARDINEMDVKEEIREDNAVKKRIELHAHTKLSQMDGVMDEVEYVKQAIKWGHRACAITDHNGCQAFPHVFNHVASYNKGKEDKDKFTAIYGCELTLIDDDVDIIIHGNDNKLLDSTYVVFDFETTGFNAGGGDSIIEIGAVKMHNGEIIEKYDELINPGRSLPQAIIDVTNITDQMLIGKDNEENAIKRFVEWFGDLPMVAHNAKFDVSFLKMAYQKYNLGEFKNPVLDTLELSRVLDSNYARHSLSALVKRYNVEWDEDAHHRADYDAQGTALVLYKMLKKLDDRNFETLNDLNNLVSKDEIHKYGKNYHINLLCKNKIGLKNMFRLISLANTKYLYKTPRILRSVVEEHREGLLIGSGCYESEVFNEARSKSEEELINVINFYDYVEVQPVDVYDHLLQSGDFENKSELIENIKKVINTTISTGKLIVATGDVHQLNDNDKIYREVIVNQKVPGGGRHPLSRNGITNIPSQYFKTTDEMLDSFNFLDDDIKYDIVVNNPNKIAEMIEQIEVIIDTGGIPFSPKVKADDSDDYLDCPKVVTDLVYTKASDLYGDNLPHNIEERIAKELYGDVLYKVCSENILNINKDLVSDSDQLEELSFKLLHETITKGFDSVKDLLRDYFKNNWDSEEELTNENIDKKMNKELGGIIGGGFDPIYLISQRLVKHSNDEGYLVGSRGSVGSSFVATMMGITEVNPLPAHYLCRNKKCKHSEFADENSRNYSMDYSSGYDLPNKKCPKCGEEYGKEGQDMPFATFLGFNADKVPDIDLNFSGDNQASAHAYTKVLFGEDNVYRAGTIGTVADKTAYGFVKGYCEDKGIVGMRSAEIERIAIGCTGVKRTTGQHPGGIVVIPQYMDVFDFTPFQFPADDVAAEWRTTHFDYHAIDQDVLKLDILGHDDPTILRMLQDLSGIDVTKLPFDDQDVISLFRNTDALGVTEEQIMCPIGTLGLPELGTKFVINMLLETKPSSFGELVKISGLSHGTDVWAGNASELIANNVVPFKDVIGCRDDIMVNLMNWGMKPIKAFKIMEFVRKGKASKDPETWAEFAKEMKEKEIPEWYIESCRKIKYMFPKAHACAYIMSAIRIAWFKVHKPNIYYAAYFSVRADDFDIETMIKGYDAIKKKIEDLQLKGYDATNKEINILECLKIALEATARGIKFANVDILKSHYRNFLIDEKDENILIPPFRTIDGLGETVANTIVEERQKKEFISIEDFQKRGKVSSTLVDKMKNMSILKDLPDSSQMTLF